ncbi:CARDB domain-containing protein [Halovivax limisalsi]|uniref:CARDB domain-containing protein n=1 Tax=Halovivax limisalsi TaxID=1453760 RepID=UPI001FFDBDB1|nr:CARDB domain-containing protein [Halovivax limisalsi]
MGALSGGWVRALVLLLGFAVVASVATVPAVAVERDDTDDESGVSLSPASEYATIEDGELTLRFDDLADRATTTAHEVFTVRANARRDLWIDHDRPGITFYVDETPGRPLDETNALRLEPGEVRAVGVEIDTRTAASGPQTFTIVTRAPGASPGLPPGGPEIPPEPPGDGDGPEKPVEPVPSRLTVTAVSVERTDVSVGETVSATATVSNPGSERIEEVLGMAVNGVLLDDRLVSVAPGERRTVTFTWQVERDGTYVASIGGVAAATVTATEPAAPAFGASELASPLAVTITPPAALALLVLRSLIRRRKFYD